MNKVDKMMSQISELMKKINEKKALKTALLFVIFMIIARKRGPMQYYTPMYNYAANPVFSYLKESDSKAVLLAGYVQSHRGLNVQLASNKQYFIPNTASDNFAGRTLLLYCYENYTQSYPEFVLAVEDCFTHRSKSEWQRISEATSAKLVMTLAHVEIPTLNRVASTEHFNLYEIPPYEIQQ